MRILHLFDFFSPYGGGTVDLLYKIAKAQVNRGHEVTIYTSDYKLDKPFIKTLSGVNVVLFHCLSSLGGFYFMPEIKKALQANIKNFDVIHTHASRSYQNMIVHQYAKKYGIPYIIDAHGSQPRGKKHIKSAMKWLYDKVYGDVILNDANMVIAETKVGIQEYLDFGVDKDKITLLSPPFDIEPFSELPRYGIFRERYNLENKRVITYFGRLNWIKGIDFLVETFAGLIKTRTDVALAIVGYDDGFKNTLVSQIDKLGIKDEVVFTGLVSGYDKLSALVDSDIVIQPSRSEQGAWSCFEAVLCGTPIIVSSHTGAGEDVKRINAGYLLKFGDVKDLEDKINYILQHPAEAKDKTLKAKAYIESNMSMKEGVKKYERLYEAVKNGKL